MMNRRTFVTAIAALAITSPALAQRAPEIDVHLNPT